MTPCLIGCGILQWHPEERRSDRYGTVWLSANDQSQALSLNQRHAEDHGRLVAEVVQSRRSSHVGDLFRNIFPVQPAVGERITLGEGVLFYGQQDATEVVGLRPLDGRDTDWLDPHQLYRAHQQRFGFGSSPQPCPALASHSMCATVGFLHSTAID